jgi:hypothetical protein
LRRAGILVEAGLGASGVPFFGSFGARSTSRGLPSPFRSSRAISGRRGSAWYRHLMRYPADVAAGSAAVAEAPRPRAEHAMPAAEVDRLADEIAELSAHLDAATHRLLELIRRFDAGSGWYTHGCLSCAQWLSWRIGLDLCAAREKVRVARALGTLPRIDDAFRHGRLSYSKVRALTRVATPENEASLLEMARSSTAAQLEKICRGYHRALNGMAGKLPCDDADQRWVRDRSTESGMIRIEAQLLPEEAALVLKAIEAARERAWKASRASAESRAEGNGCREAAAAPARRSRLHRADALVQIAEDFLASSAAEAKGPPVEIVVHVEADSLADSTSTETGTLDDGTSLPPATVDRLACDASVVTVVEDSHGNPLDVGRRRRTVPTALRRALQLRDKGCRFPGCTNTRVDSHHVLPWSRGGETKLANLVSTCRKHHRYVHELGFRVEPRNDGSFAFFAPAGWEVKPVPPPPRLRRDSVAALREQNASAGVAIDHATSFPSWDGTPADYDHIVHVLAVKYPRAEAAPRSEPPA